LEVSLITELKVVMFTDQLNSTANMRQRTFAEIKKIAIEQDHLTAEAVGSCRGKILKDRGDGHLIEFQSCSNAVRCGFILQQRVNARNASQQHDHLRFELHIGIDLGEVMLLPTGDIRANTANLAARLSDQCPGGEVYFTDKVRQEIHPRDAKVEKVGDLSFKGIDETVAIFRVLNWLGEIESGPNPFIWRDGITKAEDFFNREDETRKLTTLLRAKQNCQVVGARRIGKTSLVKQIERLNIGQYPDTLVAYLDLQDPRCFTLLGWLTLVGKQWTWPTTARSLVDFAEGIEEMLARGIHPVLLLDEFEEPILRHSEFTRDFFLTLRSCGQRGLVIITTSKRPLNELTEISDPSSAFYNTFPLMKLEAFKETAAQDFVSIYRSGVPSFTKEEKETIHDFAKGHPLALQVACYYILEARENSESLTSSMRKANDEMKATLPPVE
jgi:class 3 adenylate cyclase